MIFKTSVLKEYKVNEYITLKLMKNNKIQIFVNGEKFDQCKFLYLNILKDKLEEVNEIKSIDEAADKLDSKMEAYERDPLDVEDNIEYRLIEPRKHIPITPEQEFWAHCSNLQTWWENSYDTLLLHSNLSFPLLKKLTEIGDQIAKKVFKEEIAKRIEGGYKTTVIYLVIEEYINYLNSEELDVILENFDFSPFIKKTGEIWNEEFTTLYLLAKKSSVAKTIFKKEIVRILNEGDPRTFHDYYDVFRDFFTREEQFYALLNKQEADIMIELEHIPYFSNKKACLFRITMEIGDLDRNNYQIAIKNRNVIGLVLPECDINNFPDIILTLNNLEVLYIGVNPKDKNELKKKINQFKKLKKLDIFLLKQLILFENR